MKDYELEPFGQKKTSLAKKMLYGIIRIALVGVFLYVTYLGFTLRRIPVTSGSKTPPPAQSAAPAKKFF